MTFCLRKAGEGGGPVKLVLVSASIYAGLAFRVVLTGRFPPTFEFEFGLLTERFPPKVLLTRGDSSLFTSPPCWFSVEAGPDASVED